MPMLLTCYYRSPAAAVERLAIRDRHIEYILRHKEHIALAGAIDDQSGLAVGMFVGLATESRAQADAFMSDEPYNRARLFGSVRIDHLIQFIPHAYERFLEEELLRERDRLGRRVRGDLPLTRASAP